ncbi:acyltransferase [Pseudomonas sp. GD03842]|uniref:acyltransferase family protein n=1 Tax=Pseudomonas sp. GD03842 TaxID=2975385 RepID=UPI00244B91A7|nr:acyltransferase [Pseudomonas sp. GD03842]MDH0747071.1 acyltransferase [Pseudomonas sp. GD03842]
MERIYSLQALRGVAVLGVVLFHMTAVEGKYAGGDVLLPPWLDFFQLGVDLFFIISGFVMVIVSRGRFQKVAESKRFLFNRASRIYPTYWLYFFLTWVAVWLQPSLVNSTHGSSNLLMSFLLLPNDKVLLVMVAWSLLFELWFYLVFTGLMLFRERWLPVFLAAWALSLMSFNSVDTWQDYNAALKIVLHPYALEFIVGVALALLFYSRHCARITTPMIFGALAVALVPGVALIGYYRLFDEQGMLRMCAVGAVFGVLVLGLALLERRRRVKMPSSLVAVGDMSYTLYLSHLLVLGVVGRFWQLFGGWPNSLLDNVLFTLVMLMAVLCYGWVGYRCFEKPLLDLSNDFSRRRFRLDGIPGRA